MLIYYIMYYMKDARGRRGRRPGGAAPGRPNNIYIYRERERERHIYIYICRYM